MASGAGVLNRKNGKGIRRLFKRTLRIPIATKLTLSYLAIIILMSAIFTIAGIHIIGDRVVAEAQEKVRNDLNSAREIYQNELSHIHEVVRYTGERFFLKDAMLNNDFGAAFVELDRIKNAEGLDLLGVTDKYGYVLVRTCNPNFTGDNQGHDAVINAALYTEEPVSSTILVNGDALQANTPDLAEIANIALVDTPLARNREETIMSDGMMLKAAAPIFDYENNFIGVVYGGVLLNKNHEIVDKIKHTVYENVIYNGQDVGTATIFMDDVRISTNVRNENGSRAIGTRVSEEVYDQVVTRGEPWIGRAYVVNDWYITAYEPIRDIRNKVIGILYVGILEQKYIDIQKQTSLIFLIISFVGALITMVLSLFVSRRISVPLRKTVAASKEVANGNLDVKVDIASGDEFGWLAYSFNKMSAALKERDEQLKEFTKKKISESERLAMVGQLAANVAHELNNPLQGIVTYASLSLERENFDDAARQNLNKIVIQANRCRDIIRGLLDFSRHKNPDKTLCDVNNLLRGCISLIENQAVFHNIDIDLDLDHSLPMVIADPSQIERVFLNLIINAADAMEGTGRLTIMTTMNSMDHCVDIDVQDTGHGILPQHLEKIFDPFFTTKETGHGVGLGLAISYGIVQEHNGKLTVKSKLGKGTTFTVSLPLTDEKVGVVHG
ncbi:MAG TPA: cache domain-containing protein [Anaerolineales bacterium]|nr:cache domain-containing protein [Anaerolineales bacterium]